MSIAPPRQMTVPTILAMLLELLKSTFSNLRIASNQAFESPKWWAENDEAMGPDQGHLSPTAEVGLAR